ncbi:MAG: hypothetical protein CL388_04210 [Acidiferrobacteraceae bacterium]|nr:hypothetical protein [Acidiferrobacteraceae bacterium]
MLLAKCAARIQSTAHTVARGQHHAEQRGQSGQSRQHGNRRTQLEVLNYQGIRDQKIYRVHRGEGECCPAEGPVAIVCPSTAVIEAQAQQYRNGREAEAIAGIPQPSTGNGVTEKCGQDEYERNEGKV